MPLAASASCRDLAMLGLQQVALSLVAEQHMSKDPYMRGSSIPFLSFPHTHPPSMQQSFMWSPTTLPK